MRDEIFQMMEKNKYSGVKGTLDHVYTFLNYYKHVHKELLYEGMRIGEKEGNISNKDVVLDIVSG